MTADDGYDLTDEMDDDPDYGKDLDLEDGWAEEEEEEEADAITARDILGPDGPRVCADKCSTCIFRPGNLMKLRPGRVRQMVRDSLNGGGFITCHATLPSTAGRGRAAVCRGFFDSYGHLSNILRIYSRLGEFDYVTPPDIHADNRKDN